jgi:hypothetical protein
MMMDRRESVLYHQIHPLKLAVDWVTGWAALYWLWRRRPVIALAIGFMPSILVSAWLLRFADPAGLDHLRASAFGRYVRRYMTPAMQALRLAGFAIMAAGAWNHRAWLICAGLAAILLAWARGVIWPGVADG